MSVIHKAGNNLKGVTSIEQGARQVHSPRRDHTLTCVKGSCLLNDGEKCLFTRGKSSQKTAIMKIMMTARKAKIFETKK